MEPNLRPDLPDGAIMENGMKNQTTSADRFFGKSTIWGKDGEHRTPYMTRYWIGRLRLHIFHRGDQDPDPHDHPWDFWTLPLTPYVEEVFYAVGGIVGEKMSNYAPMRRVVPAFWPSFRPATHTHRVIGRWRGDLLWDWPGRQRGDAPRPVVRSGAGNIVTLVWRSTDKRKWGFLKNRDGRWCWVPWKEYVFGHGKSAPCE
jgi:hypothetical protein